MNNQHTAFLDALQEHREISAQINALSERQKVLRNTIEEYVRDSGNYSDDHGYARIITYRSSSNFDKSQLENLVKAWTASKDPTTQTCGMLLSNIRSVVPERNVLQVR